MDSSIFGEFDISYLHAFLTTKPIASGRAVILCPGGRYRLLSMENEGFSWVEYFNNQSIAAFVLQYRIPNGDYKLPMADAETALQLIKDNAKEWNVCPSNIGIMGFSAGGHIASTIATHTKPSLRPNFQILLYPVITMDNSFTHLGSQSNWFGEKVTDELINFFSSEKQVTKDTPLALIICSADDQAVSIQNSIKYYEALQSNQIYAGLHIYPIGGHGWGFNLSFKYHDIVLAEISIWLEQLSIN